MNDTFLKSIAACLFRVFLSGCAATTHKIKACEGDVLPADKLVRVFTRDHGLFVNSVDGKRSGTYWRWASRPAAYAGFELMLPHALNKSVSKPFSWSLVRLGKEE